MSSAGDNDALRDVVREALRELLPQLLSNSSSAQEHRTVAIRNDHDLALFVRDLIVALDDPIDGARVRAGTLDYRLTTSATESDLAPRPKVDSLLAQPALPADEGPAVVVERGAVTERIVARAIAQNARLVLSRRAVLTPLAREQIRRNNVTIERVQ